MKMLFPIQSGTAMRGVLTAVVLTVFFAFGSVTTATADHDTTPPVVTITGYPANNETAGTFLFSADEPVLGFECQLDSDPWVACVAPVFVVGLPQGPHDFRVRATDLASNLSDPPTLYSWVVDTVPPATPVISAPTSGTWTNNNQPTISGTAEAFVGVRVFDGTTLLGITTANSIGDWTFTPSSPLNDGSYSIRVRARDAATNESAYSASRALYIDTVAPDPPTITDPNQDELTNSEDLVLAGATEPFATVAISVDALSLDLVTATSAGQWSLDPVAPPAEGPHSVAATATDRAGNTGASSAAVDFELESVPPPQPTILTPASGTAQADDSITFAGTAEDQTAIALLDGSTQLASASADNQGDWDVTFNLADGEYSVVAVATDEHGNDSPPSTTVELTIDTTGPISTITAQPPTFSNQTEASFDFEANEPNVDFECSFDLTYWAPCAPIATFTGLPSGLNSFAVRGTDALGNIGAPTTAYEWTIDLDPPAAPAINNPTSPTLTNDVRAAISGTAEPHSTVEVLIESTSQTGALGIATADGTTGLWAFTPTADLPQGELEVTAVATDRAGNIGVASTALTLTVDSVAPTTSVDGAPPGDTVRSRSLTFAANELGATFVCSLDGAAFTACASPFTAADLSFGPHSFAVRATDAAGNVETLAKTSLWRTSMVDTPFGLNPRCSFERITPDNGVAITRLTAGSTRGGRQLVRFSADASGLARVSIVRRKREVAQVSLVIKKGRNDARLPIKRSFATGANAELVVATVSVAGRRTVHGIKVRTDATGSATPTEQRLRIKPSKCATPKGARPAKLRVLSSRRVADGLIVRVRSSQLTLATVRVSDEYSFAQSPVTPLRAGRSAEIAVDLPPGLGANAVAASVVLTAFNTEYARAQADLSLPGG